MGGGQLGTNSTPSKPVREAKSSTSQIGKTLPYLADADWKPFSPMAVFQRGFFASPAESEHTAGVQAAVPNSFSRSRRLMGNTAP